MKLKILIKYKARFNKMPLSILKNQDGVTAVLVAIVAAMLLGFTALAIDVGYMYSTRNELQNVADAAALAGAGELGRVYLSLGPGDLSGVEITTAHKGEINIAAQTVAFENKGAGKAIDIDERDIIISKWNWGLGPDQALTENLVEPDAVRVTARRDSSTASGTVATFFGKIFSFFGGSADTFTVSAVATAALSGPSITEDGELNTPFGISELNFPDNCDEIVTFKDTPDSCAGWHNFFEADNSNSIRNNLFNIIYADSVDDSIPIKIPVDEVPDEVFTDNNFNNGIDWLEYYFGKTATDASTPPTGIGDEFNFIGGVGPFMGSTYLEWTDNIGGPILNPPDEDDPDYPDYYSNDVWTGEILESGLIAPFPAIFDYFRMRDGDGDNSKWTATVPVYADGDTCTNPSGKTKIVGFAVVKIYAWRGPPDNEIDVFIDCKTLTYINARGGGGNFGNLKGIIPSLVQ